MRTASRIVADTQVRANIEAHEDLAIEGHVIGSLTGTALVTVAAGAIVEADVHVRRLLVHGTVVGNISAVEGVEVGATGQVKGNIRTQALTLATGGRIAGNVKTGVSVEAARPTRQRRRHLSNETRQDASNAVLDAAPSAAQTAPGANVRGVTMQGISPVSGLSQNQVLEQAAKQARDTAATDSAAPHEPSESPVERVVEESLATDSVDREVSPTAPEVVEEDSVATPDASSNHDGRHKQSKNPQNA